MREENTDKEIKKEKVIIIRFSTTNEVTAKSALKMLINAHEDVVEGDLTEAR